MVWERVPTPKKVWERRSTRSHSTAPLDTTQFRDTDWHGKVQDTARQRRTPREVQFWVLKVQISIIHEIPTDIMDVLRAQGRTKTFLCLAIIEMG